MKKNTFCLVLGLLLLFCFTTSCAGKADTKKLFTQAPAGYSGDDVEQDTEEAGKWYSLAAKQGCEEAPDYYQSVSAVENGNTLEWAKSHSADGTMFIYTRYYTLGTWIDSSNQQLDIYGCMYQNKDGFFLTLCDEQGNLVQNDGNTDLALDAELVWDEGKENEFRQGFDAGVLASDCIVRLSGTARGYVQGIFESEERKGVVLILYFPNGSVYRFPMPEDTNYNEVWEKVSDFWYIPTFNDDIYEGSDVNPDLVDFLGRFEAVFNAEIEKRRQTDVLPLLIEDLLGVNAPNKELSAMYAQYQEMEKGLYRRVDAEYYAECKARVEQALWEVTMDHASELGHGLSDVMEEFGYDDIAEISEIAAELFELMR